MPIGDNIANQLITTMMTIMIADDFTYCRLVSPLLFLLTVIVNADALTNANIQ